MTGPHGFDNELSRSIISSHMDTLRRNAKRTVEQERANLAIQKQVAMAENDLASVYCDRVVKLITEFEKTLDEEHEVACQLVSFGQTVVIHVTGLTYWNPKMVIFNGQLDDGSRVQLVQHVSQVSFLLLAAKKLNPKPNRIGFVKEEAPPGKNG